MQKVFYEVSSLDKKCYEKYALNEDILMEQASFSMTRFIEKKLKKKSEKNSTILIVCGPGNNGADGITLARQLYKKYDIKLYLPYGAKSLMAKLQLKRAKLLDEKFNANIIEKLTKNEDSYSIVVDCLFGSGLNKNLDKKSIKIINTLNKYKAYKLACDIPSGINIKGQINQVAFKANKTITMGALKVALYADEVKDYTGSIKVANLGVQKEVYEDKADVFLLERKDMKLPLRNSKNAHKGSFGHLNVVVGSKKGAGIIASKAAFIFGAGIVSVVCNEKLDLPYHIMQNHFISKNCTAIAIGMGLGNYEQKELEKILQKDIPTIIDADLFYEKIILPKLQKEVVLTPHPKEFCALLRLCDIADISVEVLQKNRFFYINKFCQKYPKPTVLLKGANTLIAKENKIYINSFGTQALSKGGSGDVLSGLIASLLAQGYNCLDATITASLAHAIASQNFDKNNYSLIPSDLMQEIKRL